MRQWGTSHSGKLVLPYGEREKIVLPEPMKSLGRDCLVRAVIVEDAATSRKGTEAWKKGVGKKHLGFSVLHPLMTCRCLHWRLQWRPGSKRTRVIQCPVCVYRWWEYYCLLHDQGSCKGYVDCPQCNSRHLQQCEWCSPGILRSGNLVLYFA